MTRSPLQFLWTVQGPPQSSVIIAVGVVAFGAYLEWTFPEGIDQAFAIALFLQLFSASTGYVDRVRQGHLDPLLAGRQDRRRLALAHWTVSVALGAAVWVLLGIIGMPDAPGHRPLAFTAAGAAAMLYSSTAVWAFSLRLGRYAGAVTWLMLLFGLAATQQLQALRVGFNPAAITWIDAFHAAGASLIFPVFLLINPAVVSNRVVAVVLLSTALVWTAGATVIAGVDAALERS